MPIRRLPDALVNLIAAGEVVERPAAALRELVENSLDAGARRVEVDLERGGKDLIRVTDDGCGIPKEEIPVALERHATSKIETADDLTRILSLGFRGEALPSIAAVSRFKLLSRMKAEDVAWEVRAEGGKISPLEARSAPPGTSVEAASLFHNTPARRKFLKTDATELSHCLDFLSRLALVRPEISFRVQHGGQTVLDAPAAPELRERAAQVLGKEARGHLYPILWEGDAAGEKIRWEGLVGSPELLSRTQSSIYLFVNGRPIRDRSLAHAVQSAYREVLVERKYPTVVLSLTIDPASVDVNIHPTKSEVRFRAPQAIYGSILKALETLFEEAPWLPAAAPTPSIPAYSTETGEVVDRQQRIQEALAAYEPKRKGWAPDYSSRALSPRPGEEKSRIESAAAKSNFFAGLDVIGQFHNEFLVCQTADALYLIDQHAAHERVYYERLREAALSPGGKGAQRLLVPKVIELPAPKALALLEAAPDLSRLGFEIESYGGGAVLVRSVPAILAERPVDELIAECASEMLERGKTRAGEQAIEEICARVACHGVIRGSTPLSREEAKALLAQMADTDYAAHCPHGRPVVREIFRADVERLFKRVI
ncbi:MAG: DNA mismatch repair endonuclease MutL [Bdellovibrionota bacterium]